MTAFAAIPFTAWYYLGLAVVVLSLLVVGVVAYRAWSEAHEDLTPVSEDDLLASFQQARSAGELDDEEYEKVRRRIRDGDAGRL